MAFSGSITSGQVTTTERAKSKATTLEENLAKVSEEQISTVATQEKQKQEQEQTAVQNILQQTQTQQQQATEQTGTSAVSGTTASTGTEQQNAITRLLGVETQESLEAAVQNLLGGTENQAESIQNLTDILTQRASGTGISDSIENILAGARVSGERELDALQTLLAQQAGGSLANAGVIAGSAEGRVNLEAQLASLQGQLQLEARGIESQELTQALEAVQQQTGVAIPLLQVLKGSETEQTGTTTTAQQAQQEQEQKTSQQTTSEILANVIAQTLGTTQTETISSILSQATTEQESQLNKLLEEIRAAETTKTSRSAEFVRNREFSLGFG